jgi:hypothetical protein
MTSRSEVADSTSIKTFMFSILVIQLQVKIMWRWVTSKCKWWTQQAQVGYFIPYPGSRALSFSCNFSIVFQFFNDEYFVIWWPLHGNWRNSHLEIVDKQSKFVLTVQHMLCDEGWLWSALWFANACGLSQQQKEGQFQHFL